MDQNHALNLIAAVFGGIAAGLISFAFVAINTLRKKTEDKKASLEKAGLHPSATVKMTTFTHL
jgi:hypothetical protein